MDPSTAPPSPSRRRFLTRVAGASALSLAGCDLALREGLLNACKAALPPQVAAHPLVVRAWSGLDPARWVDAHCHLFGIGDGGSGVVVNPRMTSLFAPAQYVQRVFYMNAGCVHNHPGKVDASVVDRLLNQHASLAPGARLLLLAFDWARDEAGAALPDRSTFYVPDAYAAAVARAHPGAFLWAASIHPYDPRAVERLEAAAADGAKAVKWLPAAQGIDPASARCDAFYRRAAELRIPLITHAGDERAVRGHDESLGNPLKLRRALDAGVRIIVAHCGSLGWARDLDAGEAGPMVESFDLFARLMDEARYQALLMGDLSAVTFGNRSDAVLETLLARGEWHPRLLYGSDYPLPGVLPLTALDRFVSRGMLPPDSLPVLRELRDHNPILFDFVLKRSLSAPGPGGARFAHTVFEAGRHFAGRP